MFYAIYCLYNIAVAICFKQVRAYAVSVLEKADDEELHCYLLQLVQALRFERSDKSRLALFLVQRCMFLLFLYTLYYNEEMFSIVIGILTVYLVLKKETIGVCSICSWLTVYFLFPYVVDQPILTFHNLTLLVKTHTSLGEAAT